MLARQVSLETAQRDRDDARTERDEIARLCDEMYAVVVCVCVQGDGALPGPRYTDILCYDIFPCGGVNCRTLCICFDYC